MKDGKFEERDANLSGRDAMYTPGISIEAANALLPQLREQWLAELLKDGVKVYGCKAEGAKTGPYYWEIQDEPREYDTHTGMEGEDVKDGKYTAEDFAGLPNPFMVPLDREEREYLAQHCNALLPALKEQWLAQGLGMEPHLSNTDKLLAEVGERIAKEPNPPLFDWDENSLRVAYLNGGLARATYDMQCRYVGAHHPEVCERLIEDAIRVAVRTDTPKLKAMVECARTALDCASQCSTFRCQQRREALAELDRLAAEAAP